jgi:AcrR family transcriptional regulator
MQRRTQTERKEQTRAELVASARAVFLERGFHVATLDEIAADAGYSKGAVYSNFESKEALFLAILDAHFEQRLTVFQSAKLSGETAEEALVLAARGVAAADRQERRWAAVLLEFWAHASRYDGLREQVSEARERYIDAVARVLDGVAADHGIEFAISTRDVVRGGVALVRGMSLERLLAPGSIPDRLFEQMVLAYTTGLIRRTNAVEATARGGKHEREHGSARVPGRGGRARRRAPGA